MTDDKDAEIARLTAALAEAEARGYVRGLEDAAEICADQFAAHMTAAICGEPDNSRTREASANMAERLLHRIRALAQKEAGAVKGGTISTGPHCDCGMIGPCMFEKCRHPLAANNGEAGK